MRKDILEATLKSLQLTFLLAEFLARHHKDNMGHVSKLETSIQESAAFLLRFKGNPGRPLPSLLQNARAKHETYLLKVYDKLLELFAGLNLPYLVESVCLAHVSHPLVKMIKTTRYLDHKGKELHPFSVGFRDAAMRPFLGPYVIVEKNFWGNWHDVDFSDKETPPLGRVLRMLLNRRDEYPWSPVLRDLMYSAAAAEAMARLLASKTNQPMLAPPSAPTSGVARGAEVQRGGENTLLPEDVRRHSRDALAFLLANPLNWPDAHELPAGTANEEVADVELLTELPREAVRFHVTLNPEVVLGLPHLKNLCAQAYHLEKELSRLPEGKPVHAMGPQSIEYILAKAFSPKTIERGETFANKSREAMQTLVADLRLYLKFQRKELESFEQSNQKQREIEALQALRSLSPELRHTLQSNPKLLSSL